MNLYKQILLKSKNIDWSKRKINKKLKFVFPVSKSHARYKILKKYNLEFVNFSKFKYRKTDLILTDHFLINSVYFDTKRFKNFEFTECSEDITKTLNFAERLLIKYFNKKIKRVVVVGGGVMLDLGSYVAEQLKAELVLVPTTIIGMCDAAIGGKVRMNFVDAGRYIKHYYKSYYEPDKVLVDFSFLTSLKKTQIFFSLAEVIKHAFVQSPKLQNYLLSENFTPSTDFESLKRVVVWTIDLKRICLTVDKEEKEQGARKIIHFAHGFANSLEAESEFKISHGEAVGKGLLAEFKNDKKKLCFSHNTYCTFP